MNLPEPLAEVHLSNLAYTAQHWLADWRGEEIFDLNAPYQRGSVWTEEQRRNLIKSLKIGLPVGNIVVAQLPYRVDGFSYRIVDGKQRVEAVRAFFSGEFTVPGWWFVPSELVEDAFRERDITIVDLSQRGRYRLQNAQMGALEFKPETETTENLNYDPSLTDTYGRAVAGHENDPNQLKWLHRKRSDEEILQAEAELYLLVNFGGVEQTDADRARAQGIATGGA